MPVMHIAGMRKYNLHATAQRFVSVVLIVFAILSNWGSNLASSGYVALSNVKVSHLTLREI